MASIELPAMEYDVINHLMNYDDVAHRTADHPDLIITVGPAQAPAPRQSIETFDRPRARPEMGNRC